MRLPKNYRWAYQRGREVLQEEGLAGLRQRGGSYLRKRGLRAVVADRSRLPKTPAGKHRWGESVVMIAARQPEQCFHYRVEQKSQAAAELGIPFRVVDPGNPDEIFSAVQLASVVIIFRQALGPAVDAAVAQARRLGVPIVYEADDIVYRRALVEQNPNMATVPRPLRSAVEAGATRYLAALRMCDHVLASTTALAHDMGGEVAGHWFVMENGIGSKMLAMADGVAADPAPPRRDPEAIVIGYGSGSLAHDSDLQVAADGLAAVMAADPRIRLHLMGTVALPDALEPFGDRVDRSAELPYGEYLRQLSACDITIAPLVDAEFNRFKSQVKCLEAGLLGVPLVASTIVYGSYVEDEVTGLLASPGDWEKQLRRLADDPQLRRALAGRAREHALQWEVSTGPKQQFAEFLAALR